MSRKLCLPLALLVFSSLPAFAQQTASAGYTACPNGEGYVYLYQSPTDFTVLANLKCGAKLEIIGNEGGYVDARTADGKQGYVPQSGITVPPVAPATESANTGGQQPPVPGATSNALLGTVSSGLGSPRAEISGGYSYLSMDLSGLGGIPRQSVNGWESSVTVNATRRLAVEAAFNWYYRNNPVGAASFYDYTLLGGPRVNIGPIFLHALFGLDRLTASLSGLPTFSQNSVAGALGGGTQWRIGPQWAVSTSVDYVPSRHSLPGSTAVTQSNIRVSVGIVFRLGGRLGGMQR